MMTVGPETSPGNSLLSQVLPIHVTKRPAFHARLIFRRTEEQEP
jgi:hypothetical protein